MKKLSPESIADAIVDTFSPDKELMRKLVAVAIRKARKDAIEDCAKLLSDQVSPSDADTRKDKFTWEILAIAHAQILRLRG